VKTKLALLLLLAVPVAAQLTETIEVQVTSIDVVVTDAKGNRIKGLTRADFEILEDGKPREITNFSEFSLIAPPKGGATAAIEGKVAVPDVQTVPPRRLMILFDANTLTPELRRRGAAAAASFVETHLRPNDTAMVAVFEEGFRPRTEWTSSAAELKAEIQKIANEVSTRTADMHRKQAEEEINDLLDLAASLASGQNAAPPPSFEQLMRTARIYADHALHEAKRTTSLLSQVVAQFSTYPEKKALVFIGEGLESRPGSEMFERLESLRTQPTIGMQAVKQMGQPAAAVQAEAAKYNNTAALQKLADDAFRKGVPIYAINPGTNAEVDTGTRDLPERTQEFARFASRSDGYQMVGNGSGGGAYIGMRAEVALGEVAADIGGYYSLGFRATTPPRRDGIKVRVKSPAAKTVRVAVAGAPLTPGDAMNDAVVAHHVLPPETNDLEIELETGDLIGAGEKPKIKLNVIIPIRNLKLARQGSEVTGGFDVYLSISDGKAYFSEVNKQSHTIRWPADTYAGEDDERTLTYSIDVTLEGGANRISVGVVDHASKKTGYETIEL
jgi:VWFA-related protein